MFRPLARNLLIGIAVAPSLFFRKRALFQKRFKSRCPERFAEIRTLRLAVLLEIAVQHHLLGRAGRNISRLARKSGIIQKYFSDLTRPHFRRQKETESERERTAVTIGDLFCQFKAFLRDRGEVLFGAEHAFQFFRRIIAPLFYAHNEARCGAPPKRNGYPHTCRNVVAAGVVEYFIHFAVGNVYDNFRNHQSPFIETAPKRGCFFQFVKSQS